MSISRDITGAILHVSGWLKGHPSRSARWPHKTGLKNDPAEGRTRWKVGAATLALATISACVILFVLEPKMLELRAQFMHDPNKANNPAYATFRQMHGTSMGLALLETIVVAIALICAVL